MPTYFEPVRTNTIQVWLGTVYGGIISAGHNVLTGVTVSPSDVGCWVTIIGSGPSNGMGGALPGGNPANYTMLIAMITSVTDAHTAVLSVNAVADSDGSAATTTIYRLVGENDPHRRIASGSLTVNLTQTARDTGEFTIQSEDGSFIAKQGTPVLIASTDPAIIALFEGGVFFGGAITQVTASNLFKSAVINSVCQIVSWDFLLAKRFIYPEQTYAGQTLKQLAQEIIYNFCDSDGLALDCPTGPVLADEGFSAKTDCGAALDQICADASAATISPISNFYWYVDAWKTVHIVDSLASPAPWTIDDTLGLGRILLQVQVKYSDEKLANRVYIDGTVIGSLQSEVMEGDGVTRNFPTQSPVLEAPIIVYDPTTVYGDLQIDFTNTNQMRSAANQFKTSQIGNILTIYGGGDGTPSGGSWNAQQVKIASVITSGALTGMATFTTPSGGPVVLGTAGAIKGQATFGGTAQTVGIYNSDTGKNWYWSLGASYVYQDAAGVTLTAGNRIAVFYPGTVQNTQFAQNIPSINERSALEGGTGFWDTSISLSSGGLAKNLVGLAQAEADNLGKTVQEVTIMTYKPGLFPTQLAAIQLVIFGIADDFFIDSVTMGTQDNLVLWTIHAVIGAIIGDWRTAFINLTKPNPSLILSAGGNALEAIWNPNYEVPISGDAMFIDPGFGIDQIYYASASGVALAGVEIYGYPPPDGLDLLFRVRRELVSGIFAQEVASVTSLGTSPSSGTIGLGGSGLPVNGYVGRIMSLLATPISNTDHVKIADFLVTANDASGNFTLSPDPTSIIAIGDLVTLRTAPTSATANSYTDSAFFNPYNPGLTVGKNAGNLALIIHGTGKGQSVRTVVDNTGDTVTVAPNWDITPDSTSVIVLLEAAPQVETLITNLKQNDNFLIGTLGVDNYRAMVIRVEAYISDAFGTVETFIHQVPYRELYLWGAQGTRLVTANTTQLITDGKILVDTTGGNVTVQLLATASVPNLQLWVAKVSADANTVKILPALGETIGNATEIDLTAYMQAVLIKADGNG